uniref:Uncharacterized protein n=1 Tax=Helianthus annuus TaxID=4232 RepID=A0A251RRY6_HELAN
MTKFLNLVRKTLILILTHLDHTIKIKNLSLFMLCYVSPTKTGRSYFTFLLLFVFPSLQFNGLDLAKRDSLRFLLFPS